MSPFEYSQTTLRLFALLVLVFMAWPARAEEPSEVDWFNQGIEFYLAGKPDQAVTAFRKADEMKPSWKLEYNIGQCEAALKRYGLAVEAFEAYLAEGGDEVPVERKDEVLAELDRLRRMIGYVRVFGEDGLDIYVDDVKRGRTPMNKTILVTAGLPHWIVFVRDNTKVHSVQGTVGGGDILEVRQPGYTGGAAPNQDVQADSVPAAAAAPAPASTPAPAPASPPQPEPTTTPPAPPEKPEKGIGPALFIVGLTGTIVFGGLTLGTGLAAGAKWEDARDALGTVEEYPWSEARSEYEDARRSGRRYQITAYVGMGLTSAFLITTVVAIPFTRWRRGKQSSEVAWSLEPYGTSGAAGLLVSGRF